MYPDQSTQIVVPKRSDFRIIDEETSLPIGLGSDGILQSPSHGDETSSEIRSYRLLTTILLSAGVWTEACHVDVTLVIDFRDLLDPNLIIDSEPDDTSNPPNGEERRGVKRKAELFDPKSFMTSSKTSTAIMSKHKSNSGPSVLGSILGHNSAPEDQLMIQLCDSVHVFVLPKPPRKGVI